MKSAARDVVGIAAVVLVAAAFGLALLVHVPAAYAVSFTATYTFTGSPGNQASEPVDSNPTGATFSAISRGAGLTAATGLNSINSSGWTTLLLADTADYYTLTATPSAGFTMNLDELAFTERRSLTGIRTFEIRSSLDGFLLPLFVPTPVPDNDANRRQTFSLGPLFDNLTSAVEFRILGYAAESAAGTWRLGVDTSSAGGGLPRNLEVKGDIHSVGEPGTLLLLAFGLIGAVATRRRYYRP